jgi:hypothetical protein
MVRALDRRRRVLDARVVDEHVEGAEVVEGLGAVGRRYAELLTQPQMTDLFGIVIAEPPRVPELAHAQFWHGRWRPNASPRWSTRPSEPWPDPSYGGRVDDFSL